MEKRVMKEFDQSESKGVEDGGDLRCCWFRDCGPEEKTGGRVGGSRGSDVQVLSGRDQDGEDQE